ncbi:hypothetical protein GTQ41_05825 [Pseudomonas sp. AN-B15]|uniref:hypothetical protein n=1 Tax=Pseudomonas sp. AN-B15 TaxID=2697023 RepID=UPI001C2CAFB3|nr:hypothetical protein [Pseudomonas sp. AN-B15]QXE08588.1 hypothetical protein GTQ41_05825 [Pseudomonas sp. AN-B15]
MNRLLAASLALMCIALSAHADDSSCKKVSALAGQAMTARQNGQLLEIRSKRSAMAANLRYL